MRPIKRLRNCTIENSLYSFQYITPFNKNHIESVLVEGLNKDGVKLDRFLVANEDVSNDNNKCYCYTDGVFKYIVEDDKITFNIVREYPGWENYFAFVKKVLQLIPSEGLMYEVISTRYISSYVNISLFNAINGKVELNCYSNIIGGELRYPVSHEDNFEGLVRVTNLLPTSPETNTSYADVELVKRKDTQSLDEALTILEQIHKLEKEDFFKILNPDFIEQLGPEYE